MFKILSLSLKYGNIQICKTTKLLIFILLLTKEKHNYANFVYTGYV